MNKRKHIKWDEGSGAKQNAQHQLPSLVATYFERVREALRHPAEQAELHSLRLLTKRLRYTLELFRPCYGPGLRTRLSALRRLQQCLGEVTDCATAVRLLARYARNNSARRRQLDQFLAKRTLETTAQFRRLWARDFDAPGKLEWWTGYLARHARPAPRKR